MGDDDRRVEPKQLFVGRGHGTTPERIADIQRRQAEVDKIRRPEPEEPFSAVLAAKAAESRHAVDEEQTESEDTRPKGPRPGLSHPAQREVFGRLKEADDSIIIKG